MSKYPMMLCALLAVAAGTTASADAVKYRKTVMQANLAHLSAIGQILKGEVPHRAHLARHAAGLDANISTVADAFKEKTEGGKTRALPAIWSDWEGFADKAAAAAKAANVLLRTIENDGDISAAMKGVGQACGACHKAYRAEKK